MYWVAGIGLALIQAVSFYFVVKGVGALLRKHWRSGAYYDAAVVCLVAAGVRTIAARARQMRAA